MAGGLPDAHLLPDVPAGPLLAAPPTTAAALRALLEADVVTAAIGLIGCRISSGVATLTIVETEAYHQLEPACHGFGGHTARAAKLRRPAGSAYVYLSYGIHKLVNVVTGSQDVASAVLIRGGVVDQDAPPPALPRGVPGPGRVGTALDAGLEDDGIDLLAGGEFRLEPAIAHGVLIGRPLAVGPRVGITKATELPWRFGVPGSPGVSAPKLPDATARG